MMFSDMDDLFISVPSDNGTTTTLTLSNNVLLITFYSFLIIALIIYLVNKAYGYYAIKPDDQE